MRENVERIYNQADAEDAVKTAVRRRKVSTNLPGLVLYIKGPGGAAGFPKGAGCGFWSGQYYAAGKWSSRGLGALPAVSFSDAKKSWGKLRSNFLDEGNLPPVRRGRRALITSAAAITARPAPAGKTFAEALEMWLAANPSAWAQKGIKARSGLAKLSLVNLDIAAITQADVLAALKDETPRQHMEKRGWLAALFSFAKAQGWRNGDSPNPARFDKDMLHGLPKLPDKKKRLKHPAMDWKKVPELMSRLGTDDASRAVALVTLTGVRSGSVQKMTWGQIKDDVWEIPATKEGEALDVPLSTAAKKILGKRPRGASANDRVFKLGANDALNTFKSFGYQDTKLNKPAVLHGQRSAFKDWCRTQTNFSDELSEIALGHAHGSEVRRRYARDNLFDKRRVLMNKWAAFATGTK